MNGEYPFNDMERRIKKVKLGVLGSVVLVNNWAWWFWERNTGRETVVFLCGHISPTWASHSVGCSAYSSTFLQWCSKSDSHKTEWTSEKPGETRERERERHYITPLLCNRFSSFALNNANLFSSLSVRAVAMFWIECIFHRPERAVPLLSLFCWSSLCLLLPLGHPPSFTF